MSGSAVEEADAISGSDDLEELARGHHDAACPRSCIFALDQDRPCDRRQRLLQSCVHVIDGVISAAAEVTGQTNRTLFDQLTCQPDMGQAQDCVRAAADGSTGRRRRVRWVETE